MMIGWPFKKRLKVISITLASLLVVLLVAIFASYRYMDIKAEKAQLRTIWLYLHSEGAVQLPQMGNIRPEVKAFLSDQKMKLGKIQAIKLLATYGSEFGPDEYVRVQVKRQRGIQEEEIQYFNETVARSWIVPAD